MEVKAEDTTAAPISQSVLDDISLLGGRPASYVDGAYTKMYRMDAGGLGCDIWVRPAGHSKASMHAHFHAWGSCTQSGSCDGGSR